MPSAPIPLKAPELVIPTAEIEAHQSVEINVETNVKHNYSHNSTVENLPNYKLWEFENAEEDSMCGMLILADVLDVERAARRHSEWMNNSEMRIKEVDSVLFVRRFRDLNRRIWRPPQCLRRLGRLMHHLSRCFGCRRRRVYKCATSAVFNPDERSELSSVESLFCT